MHGFLILLFNHMVDGVPIATSGIMIRKTSNLCSPLSCCIFAIQPHLHPPFLLDLHIQSRYHGNSINDASQSSSTIWPTSLFHHLGAPLLLVRFEVSVVSTTTLSLPSLAASSLSLESLELLAVAYGGETFSPTNCLVLFFEFILLLSMFRFVTISLCQ